LPVFSTRTGFDAWMADVAALLRLIDPDAYGFVVQHSSLAAVLTECPVPGLTSATRAQVAGRA